MSADGLGRPLGRTEPYLPNYRPSPTPSELRVKAEAERMKIVRAEVEEDMRKLGQLLQVVRPDCGPLVPLRIVK